jgi:hypothetical protein
VGQAADVITIRANDAAAAALGLPFDAEQPFTGQDPGELGRRLRAGGLARDERAALYVPNLSYRYPHVPEFATLTERECWMNSWHLDDHPGVQVHTDEEGTPRITVEDQVHMLKQGITLARIVRDVARQLPDPPPTCCVITTNSTNGVFKFCQLRPAETYLPPGSQDTRGIPHALIGIAMTIEIEEHPG